MGLISYYNIELIWINIWSRCNIRFLNNNSNLRFFVAIKFCKIFKYNLCAVYCLELDNKLYNQNKETSIYMFTIRSSESMEINFLTWHLCLYIFASKTITCDFFPIYMHINKLDNCTYLLWDKYWHIFFNCFCIELALMYILKLS